MPTCNQCQDKFPNSILINGTRKNLQNRKFCLTCSPFGQHNTRDIRKPTRYKRGDYHYVKLFRDRKKQKCVDLLGGKCQICGYNKHFKILEFHHLDPKEKDFTISHFPSWGFERVKSEILKCALLCPNCHREVHLGLAHVP